jgi:hypothetical protein
MNTGNGTSINTICNTFTSIGHNRMRHGVLSLLRSASEAK